MTYREQEYMINIIVNQVIFTNNLGEIEYHPERLDMLFGYFYAKYFLNKEFEKEYDFELDMASLEYYEELKEIVNDIKIESCDLVEWSNIKATINAKIEFEKNRYFKRDNYSLTDAYLAGLLNKFTEWIEDKGIDKLMTVLSKTGEELGSKDV